MKSLIITSSLPFPPIQWWQYIINENQFILNKSELYRKSTPSNRYLLTGSQGKQLLSIPLQGGRNQKLPIDKVLISDQEDWRGHHWKTIKTLYQRAPFFEFYAPEIELLFQKKTDQLFEWNKASINLIIKLLNLNVSIIDHDQSNTNEITASNILEIKKTGNQVYYHQVFQDKIAFQANCSILDLIFCEGNNAIPLLKNK